MSNKQSSIEWLFDQMAQLCEDYDNGEINYTNYVNRVKEAKAQAEEMHKQEIVDAYKFGISDEYVIGSEEYYNETFNKWKKKTK